VAISGLVMFFWLGASSCNAVVVALGVAMLYVERRKNKKNKNNKLYCIVLHCNVLYTETQMYCTGSALVCPCGGLGWLLKY
jgi:hypothetical protein